MHHNPPFDGRGLLSEPASYTQGFGNGSGRAMNHQDVRPMGPSIQQQTALLSEKSAIIINMVDKIFHNLEAPAPTNEAKGLEQAGTINNQLSGTLRNLSYIEQRLEEIYNRLF